MARTAPRTSPVSTTVRTEVFIVVESYAQAVITSMTYTKLTANSPVNSLVKPRIQQLTELKWNTDQREFYATNYNKDREEIFCRSIVRARGAVQ